MGQDPYGIIYVALCTVNQKQYVGQTTKSLQVRWQRHLTRRGRIRGFSQAIKKYGQDAFTLRIVDTAFDADDLNQKEQFWIKTLNTMVPNGYNLNEGGSVIRPVDGPSPETRAKMRAAKLGVPRTQDTKDKIRVAFAGKPQSPDVVAKRTESIRATFAIRGEDIAQKISIANTGKKRTDDVRERMSAARKGKKQTPEAEAKRQASYRATIIARQAAAPPPPPKQKSVETRQKMSEARKAYWERKRMVDAHDLRSRSES